MRLVFPFLLFFALNGTAQNTLALTEGTLSPKADLSALSWMEGHWKGGAFGGIAEEIWAPPLGGSMMFVFKLVVDEQVSFYEIWHVKEVDETLVFELKHFHGDLKGWEEKDEVQSFKLIKAEADRVYFDGLTFEKIGQDEVNIYVVIGDEDGGTEEVKFNYKRQ